MARFKNLLIALAGELIAVWFIYDNWINPDPNWRSPKAEAAGPLFFVIFTPWLLYAIYRIIRPHKLAVGTRVGFKNGDELVLGTISEMNGDFCKVFTNAGSYEMNRYDLSPAWGPSVGDRVRVRWSDGALYPGHVRQLAMEQVFVTMSDGRELWVPMSHVMRG